MNNLEGGRRDGQFYLKSTTLDFCKTAEGKVVGYELYAEMSAAQLISETVQFKGKPAFTLVSFIPTCTGDEAGTGGGIHSGVFGKICSPLEADRCKTVRAEGSYVIPRTARFWMNGAAPGSGNTIGKLFWRPNAKPGGGSAAGKGDPPVKPETAKEQGFLNQLGQKLSSIDGIVDLAQQAYALAKTDWRNPGAALGALSGIAGFVGLDQAAAVGGVAQKGYQLATTDWSNPGSLLGAAANLAGFGMFAGGQFGNVAGVISQVAAMGQTAYHAIQATSQASGDSTATSGPTAPIAQVRSAVPIVANNLSRPERAEDVVCGLSGNLWQQGTVVLNRNQAIMAMSAAGTPLSDTNPEVQPETHLERDFVKTIPHRG